MSTYMVKQALLHYFGPVFVSCDSHTVKKLYDQYVVTTMFLHCFN